EKVEMQFLSDVYTSCPECQGSRFRQEILEVAYRGRTIHDVLNLTVTEAIEFFKDTPDVEYGLRPLRAVGLDYVRLGQPLTTLSGGESQRLKLAAHMARARKSGTLFIFDEPTTGLHFHDIEKLLRFGRIDRPGPLGRGDRAQHGSDQVRRSHHRPGAGGRR